MNIEPATLITNFRAAGLAEPILTRLKEGATPAGVARWLQEDMLEHTDVPPATLTSAVKQLFVEQVPLEERMKMVGRRSAIKTTVDKHRRRTSALEGLEAMAFLLEGRIELAHEEELRMAEWLREHDSIEDMLHEEEGSRGRKGRKRESVLSGTLDNTLETYRRFLMNIHEIRQDLNYDPTQTSKESRKGIGAGDETYIQKRGKLAQLLKNAAEKMAEEPVDAEFTPVAEPSG